MGMKDLAEGREVEFPPEGWSGTVVCVDARAGETAKGNPSFGLYLEVLGGEDQSKSFWDNIYFSDNARYNDQQFTKLEAAGVERKFWDSDPEPDPQVVDKLIGLRFSVQATWDPNADDPNRPWLRCIYYPLPEGSDDSTKAPF